MSDGPVGSVEARLDKIESGLNEVKQTVDDLSKSVDSKLHKLEDRMNSNKSTLLLWLVGLFLASSVTLITVVITLFVYQSGNFQALIEANFKNLQAQTQLMMRDRQYSTPDNSQTTDRPSVPDAPPPAPGSDGH